MVDVVIPNNGITLARQDIEWQVSIWLLQQCCLEMVLAR